MFEEMGYGDEERSMIRSAKCVELPRVTSSTKFVRIDESTSGL
jgi:hypothetical protein